MVPAGDSDTTPGKSPRALTLSRPGGTIEAVKYLTTLEVAHQLEVSKQTLLNWLYDGKVPEPPRNRKGYRLWSPSRVTLVKKLISDGRLHTRTVIHREATNRPDLVAEYAREVHQFLVDGSVDPEAFLRELGRLNPGVQSRLVAVRKTLPASARSRPA